MTDEEKKGEKKKMKITVIELLNKIAKGEMPDIIKHKGIVYKYEKNETEEGYVGIDNQGYYYSLSDIIEGSKERLNEEVEIVEEIDIQNLKGIELTGTTTSKDNDIRLAYSLIHECESKLNEFLLAIKQLDNKIKEK